MSSMHGTQHVPSLVALDSVVQPSTYELDMDVCTIGRYEECQIVINPDKKTVSRLHAKIERSGPRYFLSDIGSANGTFVNGERIAGPHLLVNDDTIGLGSKEPMLRFHDPDPTIIQRRMDWLHYDEPAMRFYLRGKPIDLAIGPFRLLLHLYNHAGEVCTREQCAEVVFGPDYDPGQFAGLDETINKLRTKLCQAEPTIDKETRDIIRKKMVTTRRGLGYVLYLHPDDAE